MRKRLACLLMSFIVTVTILTGCGTADNLEFPALSSIY